ncbi:hypothetical protein C5S30_03710 [ANME-1 cluster archaeon GoMg4]|nr:hypothetical protein [ANME-1 cluster archaeon GoMg4]
MKSENKKAISSIGITAILAISFIVFFLVAIPGVQASSDPTYYVNATSGDDAYTNEQAQNPATPWKTIGHAVTNASDGDTIVVVAGAYSTATNGETFPLTINTANLTLKGAQFGVDPTAEGARADEADESIIDATGAAGNAVEIGASGETLSRVTFNGFTVKNATAGKAAIVVGDPDSGHYSITNDNITISNNILTANKRGLGIYDNRESLVENNRIVDNSDIAIYMAAVESSTEIKGNTITDNYAPNGNYGAITVSYGAHYLLTQPTITDNYISNNGVQGFMIRGASAIIRGNTITGHSSAGIAFWMHVTGIPTAIVEDNIITNNGDGSGDLPCGIRIAQAAPIVKGNTISGNNLDGIVILKSHRGEDGDRDASIENNTISNNVRDGIYFYNSAGSSPTITGNTLTGNGNDGILLAAPQGTGNVCNPTIHFNNIDGNTNYGVENNDITVTLDATNNWWGDPSGPGPVGPGTGDNVSDNVDYDPWLGAEVEETESETIDGDGTMEDTPTGGDVTIDATGDHTITTAKYEENPGGKLTFEATGDYWDVHLDNATGVTSITIEFCPADPGDTIYYWNATSNSWKPCSDQAYADGCITVTITDATEPNLEDLTGQEFGSGRQGQGAPEQVPGLTPIGLLALIGILSAVLAVATMKREG